MAFGKENKQAFDVLQHLSTVACIYLFLSAPVPATGERTVDTSQTTLLERGTRAELPCRVDIDVDFITWYKFLRNQALGLVFWHFNANPQLKGGPSYEEGSKDIDGNFSLIINTVEIADEGTYICEVADADTGGFLRKRTHVNVYASPREPYPKIAECIGANTTETEQGCTSAASSANITCFVEEYYPNITLFFSHRNNKINNSITNEITNADGTFNKSIVAKVSASNEPYTCVATDVPGNHENKAADIIILPPPQPSPYKEAIIQNDLNLAAIITPIVVIAVFLVTSFAIMLVYFGKQERRRNVSKLKIAFFILFPPAFVYFYVNRKRKVEDQKEGGDKVDINMTEVPKVAGSSGHQHKQDEEGTSNNLSYEENIPG